MICDNYHFIRLHNLTLFDYFCSALFYICFTKIYTKGIMAITIDYVVLPHLRKADGTNFIRIRVTHQRKCKYIRTNIALEPSDLTRSGNVKHEGKKNLAEDEVRKWRTAAGKLSTYLVHDMEIDGVVRCIEAKIAEAEEFHLNFARYGMQIADGLKYNTANNYRSAINCLVRYYGHEPDITEMTVKSMRGFEEYARKEKALLKHPKKPGIIKMNKTKSEAAIVKYLSAIRAIYNKARLEFNDPDLGVMRIPFDIFEYYKVPKAPAPENRDIPAEWVQLMIDQRKTLEGRQRLAIDSFLICFGLMGMNAIDMFTCSKAKDGIVHYYRTKTTERKDDKAEMYVRIEPCIMAIINDYKGKERLFDFHVRHANSKSFGSALNDGLRQWISRNNLEQDFTFYSARHTWATIAASKQVGVDYAIVTEGLTHSDASRQMDKVYIRKDWERVWDANAKVLGLFDWK